MIKSQENYMGAWAFLIGVILASLIGISTTIIPNPIVIRYSGQIYGALIILGIIVGYLNVIGRDSQTFLLAGAVLIIASKFGMESVMEGSLIGLPIADIIKTIFSALLTLFVPATIIVALKTVFSIAKV